MSKHQALVAVMRNSGAENERVEVNSQQEVIEVDSSRAMARSAQKIEFEEAKTKAVLHCNKSIGEQSQGKQGKTGQPYHLRNRMASKTVSESAANSSQ